MARAESLRALVTARAGGACEYCRLLEAASGSTFHLEHITPRKRHGVTTLANLALSCPGCNLAKGDRVECVDLQGGTQRLYNPRQYEPAILGWHLHFTLERDTGLILPRTPTGEATVTLLSVNTPLRLAARRLQMAAGLIG